MSNKSGFEHARSIPIEPNTRFERLTVISFDEFRMVGIKNPQKKAYYNCKCDCGNLIKANRNQLVSGNTKSCGCLAKEITGNRVRGKPSVNRKKDGEAAFSHLLATYKHGAKTRGHEFNLSKEEFKKLTESNCYYCNTFPSQICKHNTHRAYSTTPYVYNGVDRLDNTKGYILDNVVACCGKCNKIKGILSEIDFIQTVKQIYEHRFKKN